MTDIILAAPRGFCAGVERAVKVVELALKAYGKPLYVKHQIVHNTHVVSTLEKQGAVFVEQVEDIPPGSVAVFSAHGSPPADYAKARERSLTVVDATCPLVTKVHMEAIRYSRDGCNILLIGHEGHDEVIGTMGEAPQSITLVETPEEVDALAFPPDAKIAYLTQTTLSVDEANRVIARLKERYPGIHSPPKEDICYATTNRQEAVALLVPQADVVIVLGSQNSSNSLRLKEIGLSCGKPAYLVDGARELQPDWFEGCQTVLITAGASAPEVVVQECVDWLAECYGARVREVTTREEYVNFPLPKELRTLKSGAQQ